MFAEWLARSVARLSLGESPGIVAVSGGPDSVALARGLANLNLSFTVAHVNYHLRGDDSEADEEFVRVLAHTLGRAVRVYSVPLRAELLEQPDNLENAARNRRYDWFASLAQELGVRWIATGHTQDDQSETILHRLLRGTGLQGLRGMPERRPLVSPEIELVRPLLGIRRRKVLEYLEAENQEYRVDASNQDLRLTRNRIRHELIPLMESFNPEFASLLSGLAEQAGEAWQREQQRAQDLLSQVELRASGGEVILKTHALRELSDADLREVYRLVWRRQNWPERQMSFRHWQDLADLSRLDSAARDFPGRVHFRNRGKVITLALR